MWDDTENTAQENTAQGNTAKDEPPPDILAKFNAMSGFPVPEVFYNVDKYTR